LLSARRITLDLTPEAVDLLADKGFDPVYGARPLKRSIQRYLQDPLATAILDGGVKDGDTIIVEEENGALLFSAAAIQE